MKNCITYLFVTALVLIVFSCTKNNIEESVTAPQGEPTVRTLTCTFAQPDPASKVEIDYSTGKTTWEVGDEILVHGEYIGTNGGKQYSTTITLAAGDISADGKTATISVPIDENGISGIVPYIHIDSSTHERDYKSTLYAVYPASAVKTGSYSTYYYSVFTDFSEPIAAAYDKDDHFVFYNIGSMITFSVPNTEDFDSYVFAGNAGTETVGYDQFSVRVGWLLTENLKYDVPYSSSSSTYGTIGAKKSISGSVVCDGSTHTVFIPGGVNLSKGFIFYFLKGGIVKKTLTSKEDTPIDLSINPTTKKGKILPLGDISSNLVSYVAPSSHSSSISMTGAVDLSGTASANCYLLDSNVGVAGNKVFTFKSYKGNSGTNVGAIASVGVIWETNNGESSVSVGSVIAKADYEKLSDKDYSTVVFQMPSTLKAGNASIAAFDGPLCTGNILWSWHIWIPSTDVECDNYGIVKETSLMDRNLGALKVADTPSDKFVDVTSIGMVYQWGRKDPFLGPDKVKSESYRGWATYAGTKSFSVASRVLSLDESIKNPTLFATGSSTNKNWLSPYNEELWGDTGSKSIYDPCPPGYRVPKYDSAKSLWVRSSISSKTGWSTNSSYYWFTLGSPAAKFPCAGYRTGSDFKTDYRTVIWTSHSSSWQGSYDEPYYSSYACYMLSGAVQDDSVYNYYGGSVRCVAE